MFVTGSMNDAHMFFFVVVLCIYIYIYIEGWSCAAQWSFHRSRSSAAHSILHHIHIMIIIIALHLNLRNVAVVLELFPPICLLRLLSKYSILIRSDRSEPSTGRQEDKLIALLLCIYILNAFRITIIYVHIQQQKLAVWLSFAWFACVQQQQYIFASRFMWVK